MKIRSVCIVAILVLSPSIHASEKASAGRYLARPLSGDYYMFGGSVGDKTPPSFKDRKLSIMISGELARDMFNHIGPDDRKACELSSNHRERRRGDLTCMWEKDDGYTCYFGVDVTTGKSIRDATC